MLSATPDVSVVLPARNAASVLPAQLAALAAQDHPGPWELVVVDDGSTDATAVVAAAWDGPAPLQLVRVAHAGVAAARNAGTRAASARLIAGCDADDVVDAHWLSGLHTALGAHPVVGGRLDYERLNPPALRATRQPDGAAGLVEVRGFLPYVVGANLAFDREVFDALGGFDPAFRRCGDDVDFCWRAQQRGFTLGFAADALVHYRLRAELGAFYRQGRSYSESLVDLYAKHKIHGMPPPRPHAARRAVRTLASLVARVPELLGPDTRWRYVGRLARFTGRMRGLARHGVLYL